ncbi:FUN14 domain-containing protein 1-like [Halyomorpha halys]|uniref:FUN14 domain-containing protein 1-like n=1 Tax=Halyomorpha halys TaxID=286706 RepID=UPI0034D26AAE
MAWKAAVNAKANWMEETKASNSFIGTRVLTSNSIPSQLVIGSAAGALSGYLTKEVGKGWGIAVGATLAVLRIAGHIAKRTRPCAFCGVRPGEMNLIEQIVNEAVMFLYRNLFVATGFCGGFMVAHSLT